MKTLRQAAEQLLESFDDYPQQMWHIGEKIETLRKALADCRSEELIAENQRWLYVVIDPLRKEPFLSESGIDGQIIGKIRLEDV